MKAPTTIILAAMALTCNGQTAHSALDINSRTLEHNSVVTDLTDFVYDGASVNKYYQYATSYSQLALGYDYRSEDQAMETWNGNGIVQGYFNVQSYLRLSRSSVAYGGAGYENGKIKNVLWNSTADYEFLYPYILADSLGGDLTHEQYHFYGGYAHQGNHWAYGLSGSYRAVQNYRQVDPRPRDIATDLDIEISLARNAGPHLLSLAADVRFYKQVLDVEYYSQTGANTTQFQFTGLGQSYSRFDGTTYTETRHKGLGFGAKAALLPRSGQGWMAIVAFNQQKTNRQLHELNEAPLTTLWTHTISTGIGHASYGKSVNSSIALTGTYQRRQGEEAVIDNGYLGGFEILDRHCMYDSHSLTARLAAAAEWHNQHSRFTVSPAVGFVYSFEDYKDPYSKISAEHLLVKLTTEYVRHLSMWLFSIGANANWRNCIDDEFAIPSRYLDELVYTKLIYDHNRLTDSLVTLNPYLTLQHRTSVMGSIYLSLSYRQRLHNFGRDQMIAVSAGYRF